MLLKNKTKLNNTNQVARHLSKKVLKQLKSAQDNQLRQLKANAALIQDVFSSEQKIFKFTNKAKDRLLWPEAVIKAA